MTDIKQLQYFVVCADVGSFSEAARILYTTQSNVSKIIHGMEAEMGITLFVRHARGISLTAAGKQVHTYANKILEDMETLEDISRAKPLQWLNISSNPSSWFADRFVAYYNLHEKDDLHCHVYTGNVRDLMRRLRDYKEELSFVYVMEDRLASFQYALERKKLEFTGLTTIETRLYPGGVWNEKDVSDRLSEGKEELGKLKYIQNFQDEFSQNYSLGIPPDEIRLDVAVVTNRDYIMEKMLQHSRLANISGSYLSGDESGQQENGFVLNGECRILFGYMTRKGEPLSSQIGMAQNPRPGLLRYF